MAHQDFWISVLKRLQPTISRANFCTWFQNSTVSKIEDSCLTVELPTVYASKWLASKYDMKILQAAKELDASIEKIVYEVNGFLDSNNEGVNVDKIFDNTSVKKSRKVAKKQEVNITKPGSKAKVSSQILNNRYTLNNFIIGLDNRLPHAACNAVVNTPGGIYNPLYIYGEVGLGKTHLLQSIGNGILSLYPDMVVKYITAERFVSEVVDAIGKRHMKQFKQQYRNVDCFLIDDVQFFARKNSSQQEFFHTFNELYEAGKQIVLTSDRSPGELDGLDERLKSRFGMGMVVELLSPDFETRLAILHQKCREYQILIDPEVLSFIATNVEGSVRTLEGILKQIVGDIQLFNTFPTLRSVTKIIKKMNKAVEIIGYDAPQDRAHRSVRNSVELMEVVADYYNVEVSDLIGKSRSRSVLHPRQVCMYLIKQELQESYEKIGTGFGGRNHTTVMHACNKTIERLKTDVRLLREVNTLKREMGF